MYEKRRDEGRIVLTDRSIKSNLAAGVGAESPQVDRLYSEKHKAEDVELIIAWREVTVSLCEGKEGIWEGIWKCSVLLYQLELIELNMWHITD